MAAVRTSAQRIRDRMAIAAVILITIIMLAPIYWIASTAFKPAVRQPWLTVQHRSPVCSPT